MSDLRVRDATRADLGVLVEFNQAMAKQRYLLPMWFVSWTIGYQSDVKLTFPPLPDGGGKPLFVYGRVPVLGISKS